MDNLTHSVVGLGIGALVDRSIADEPDAARQQARTRMLLTIGCLASNFPDLDLVTTQWLEAPLGYLLHHRGHTHTLVGALVELTVLLGLVWLLWPNARALLRASAGARLGALAAAALGLLLHIGMDGLNVYGVHPFWPFNPNWFYGSLFQTPKCYISILIQGFFGGITHQVISSHINVAFREILARSTYNIRIGFRPSGI